MSDGKVEIGVEIEDEGIGSEASRAGREAGKGIEEGIKDGTEKSGGLLEGLKGKFSTVFAAMGGIAAGFSMANVASEIVDTGRQFETSMSKVAALSGAGEEELAALEAKAREMGAETTFSASQAADALGYMALAGWDANQSMEGLPGVLSLAQAGQMDLAEASDLVTDYLSAFGMEASDTGRMVDVLAYAQANANTTVEGLGMAFKNTAANAHAAGMDVETTTAAISMMANQGLKGSEAGTAMAAALRDMTSKAEDGAIKIGDTSVAISDSEGNFRDFADILTDVEAATAGMGEQEKQAALMATFTADSIRGLNLMLNSGSDELRSFRDELYASSGAGQAMADTMTDNLEGDLKELGSALEELQLKVYENLKEPLRDATQFATGVVVPALTTLLQNFDKVGPILATVGLALLAYRKNWDIVTASQNLAQKAFAQTEGQLLRYKTEVVAGEQVTYRLDKATGQYVRTSKTLGTSIATSTVGIKAQTAAQKASAAASEIMGKAASVAGKAVRTMAPMAALAAIMSIAEKFREGAEAAETLERATDGLSSSLDRVGDGGSGIASVADKYEASAREIIASSREAISAQADLADSIGDSFSELTANSQLVDTYSATIEKLAGRSNLTASEQGELAAAVSGLNSVCGTTYEVVDSVNGQLSASTSEILRNAEAWKQNAEAQAYQEAYQEAVKNRIKQEEELAQVTEKANAAERDFEFAIGEVRIIEGFATAEANELAEQRDMQAEATDAAADMEERLRSKAEEAAATQQQQAQASQQQADASAEAAEAAAAQSEEQQKAIEAVDAAAEKSEYFAEAMADAKMSSEDMAAALGVTGDSADELAGSVDSLAQKTGDAFTLIEEKSDISTEKMLETLQENTQTTAEWSDNITALYNKAGSQIETDFIGYLANLGPEYAPIIDELVNDSSGKLSQLAQAWAEGVQTGGDAALDAAGVTSEGVREKIAQAGEGAEQSGAAVPEAAASGIEANAGAATGAAESVGSQVNSAMVNSVNAGQGQITAAYGNVLSQGASGAQSQGVAAMGYAATATGQAYADGLDRTSNMAQASGSAVSKAGADGVLTTAPLYNAAGAKEGAQVASGMRSMTAVVNAAAKQLASSAVNAMNSATGQAKSIGANIVAGVVAGVNGSKGKLTSAMKSMAREALSAAKEELDIQSPSKKAEKEIGRNLALGVANGIKKNSKYASKSASEMSDAIMKKATTRLSNYKRVHDMSIKDEIAYWKEIVKQTKKGTKARSEANQKYKEAQKKSNDSLVKARETFQKSIKKTQEQLVKDEQKYRDEVKKIQEQLAEDIAEANEKYREAVNDRKESILGGFDIFSRFNHDEIANADAMTEALRMQAEAAEEYSANIAALKAKIGEGDLFDELADQGVGALAQIKALNQMTNAQLKEYVALYDRRSDAAYKTAVLESEGVKRETEKEIAELKKTASAEIAEAKKTFQAARAEANAQMKAAAKELSSETAKLGTKAAASVSKMAKSISKSSKDIVSSIDKSVKAIEKLSKATSKKSTSKSSTAKKSTSKQAASKARASEPSAVAYDSAGKARGVMVAAYSGDDIIDQVQRSVQSSIGSLVLGAVDAGGTVNNSTSNQTINFNAPVQSPDEIARTMRMQQMYGLAGRN